MTVARSGEWLTLDFPAWETEPVVPPSLLLETLGITEYKEVRVARDYMVVLDNQRQVEALRPNINAMLPLGKMVCITAPGEEKYDFVSRFFCPGEAVAEDPVTGSAHSMLIPYWAEKLKKNADAGAPGRRTWRGFTLPASGGSSPHRRTGNNLSAG